MRRSRHAVIVPKAGRSSRSKGPAPGAALDLTPPQPVRLRRAQGELIMKLTAAGFIDRVYAWANDNVERIEAMNQVSGGWEAWALAEIAAYIQNGTPGAYIARDPMVYIDRSSADFLVNDLAMNDVEDEIVVEMKCEFHRDWNGFVEAVKFDSYKLDNAMRLELGHAHKVSLGLFITPDIDLLSSPQSNYDIRFTRVDPASGNAIGVVSLAWQRK
jgi:hypothetical protein